MKTKIVVFFLLVCIFLVGYESDKVTNDPIDKMVFEEIKENKELEDYVIGVVACEMPALFEEEALKAMSVAARTYAMYKMKNEENYDLYNSDSDQCYITNKEMKDKWNNDYDKYYNKIKDIVYKTKNEYMTYKDEVIIAFYFSISNGYTENSENVFSEKLDYLKSVDSSWDKDYSYKEDSVTYNVKDFLSKLNMTDKEIKNIEIKRYNTNRAKEIIINDNTFVGTKFRTLLDLKSTDIDIKCDNDEITIYTKGYGHGVGMSQYGANSMAKKGYDYKEILKYYYTDIEIMNK